MRGDQGKPSGIAGLATAEVVESMVGDARLDGMRRATGVARRCCTTVVLEQVAKQVNAPTTRDSDNVDG